MIENPILRGFNPDPCICRKNDDYYIAVSSFEWMPAIPVYHSRDLKHWQLISHIISGDEKINLKNLPSGKGIWAPCLTYNEEEDLFYVVYGVMNSMNARYFDVDNYLITSKSIHGPWSNPVYLHSAGFDASLFHDTDLRKYVVSLMWETRDGYEKPGKICIAEYDPANKKIIGDPVRIFGGATDRGCIEAPHIYKRGGMYYLMCAEGGTGYYHSVTLSRSDNIYGPYIPFDNNPVLTSSPDNHFERDNTDHLKPEYYNPDSYLQKAGHGSLIETPGGETYMAYLCARPFMPEKRCTLGRETAIQKMEWQRDGSLCVAGGGNYALNRTVEPDLINYPFPEEKEKDNFSKSKIDIHYYSPRIPAKSFATLDRRNKRLLLRGQENLSSTNRVSLLAKKLTSVNAEIIAEMDFTPENFAHSAGIVLYYDNMNYLFLRKYFSETYFSSALIVTRVNNGVKTDYTDSRIQIEDNANIFLRLRVDGKYSYFEWSYDNLTYKRIGILFDTTEFSDEYSSYGEFTGTFAGMAAVDSFFHEKTAVFNSFTYRNL